MASTTLAVIDFLKFQFMRLAYALMRPGTQYKTPQQGTQTCIPPYQCVLHARQPLVTIFLKTRLRLYQALGPLMSQ